MTSAWHKSLFASAAAGVLVLGLSSVASAMPVNIDPRAGNPGNGSGGNFQLQSGTNLGNTDISAGGTGSADQRVYMGSCNSGTCNFSELMVVQISTLTGIAGNLGLGTTWQLFALVTVSGQGTWSNTTTNGKSPTFTVNTGATTVDLQLYGTNNNKFGQNGDPVINGIYDSGTNTYSAPTFSLTPGKSVTHGFIDANNDGTAPNGDYFMATGNTARTNPGGTCWDGTAGATTSCILLADGTNTTLSMLISGQAATGNQEEFSISTLLSPESYATGANGFWDGDSNDTLVINSTLGPGEGFFSIKDNNCYNSSPIQCQYEGTSAVNWDISTGVPEPGSMALLGSGLLGLGLLRRRRRR